MKANRWEIQKFLIPEDCQKIIDTAEHIGFHQAELHTKAGASIKLEYRNNERVMFDNKIMAKWLWERIKDDTRLINPGWKAIGLNERFKVYKYVDSKNHYFALHFDGSYDKIPMEEVSWITMLIYLNEDYEGGETSFMDGVVTPQIGLAALMTQHNVLHEALEVKRGTKYVLRTDVMYRKTK